jgi:O-antigen/teichoic acid export membrane protein
VIAVRWPMGVYNGALYGADKLAEASVIGLIMVVLTGLAALAALELISPTIEAFFVTQAIGSGLFLIILRYAAWRALGGKHVVGFDTEALRRIWRFSAGLGVTAIAGVIFTQADKLLLGKYASLDQLALYALAGLVARTLGIVAAPTFNVLYPRLTAFHTTGDEVSLLRTYKLGTRAFVTVCFATAAFVAMYARDLVFLWTGNAELSAQVAPLVQLVLWGTAANSAMVFPYALQLAAGRSDVAARISIGLLVIAIPVILLLVIDHGAIGAAIAWAAINTLYLLVCPWITHKFILRGQALAWLRQDIGMPLVSTAIFSVAGGFVARQFFSSLWGNLMSGAILSSCAVGLVIVTTPEAMSWLNDNWRRLERRKALEGSS